MYVCYNMYGQMQINQIHVTYPRNPSCRAGFGWSRRIPPVERMSTKTSKTLINELVAADIGERHFSIWTKKEQDEVIRRYGLSSSQFKNRTEAATILTHLHTIDFQTDHLAVLTLIDELGLPPCGARSKQQFSFYLLSFMCEKLKFPPWDPLPVLNIVVPKHEVLSDQVSSNVPIRFGISTRGLTSIFTGRRIQLQYYGTFEETRVQ